MRYSNKKILIPISSPPKTYLSALSSVGLTPVCSFSESEVSNYGGLLLTGGEDILPAFYGSKIPFSEGNLIRDMREFTILEKFYSKKLPILGVCRGLQIINVFFGGTLKNVSSHQTKTKDLYHAVNPISEGFLKGFLSVNSSHHQAVDILPSKAKNVLFSADGIVEGFQIENNILAVQFHPERMDLSSIMKIYGSFANAVFNHVL